MFLECRYKDWVIKFELAIQNHVGREINFNMYSIRGERRRFSTCIITGIKEELKELFQIEEFIQKYFCC